MTAPATTALRGSPNPGLGASPSGGPPDPRAAFQQAVVGGAATPQDQRSAQTELYKMLGLPEGAVGNPRAEAAAQQRLGQMLDKMDIKIGNPPDYGRAREQMIDKLQTQPGMSRDELAQAPLHDLIKRFQGVQQQEAMRHAQEQAGPPAQGGPQQRGGPQGGSQAGAEEGGPGQQPAPQRPRHAHGARTRPQQRQAAHRSPQARHAQRQHSHQTRQAHRPDQPRNAQAAQPRHAAAVAPPREQQRASATPQQIGAGIGQAWMGANPTERASLAPRINEALRAQPQLREHIPPAVLQEIEALRPTG